MPIPPQFIKSNKAKGKEKEGKAEPGDSPAEDAAEGDKPNPFAKKKAPAKKKPGNAAEDKLDGGKDDAQETPTKASTKRAMLLAMARKG